ncbi:PfkB family carbohydrate kinase [Arthrobacter sp. MA-N2]|uniref:PfkB family carbohydrate kinase n=1 Tax=Arthrobacter sp. MA-N2 TaxID=1101188 RepID=UPI000481776B|nr:PfkB family carbohydrate kinase [Arthrobacter sp. MA-N2]
MQASERPALGSIGDNTIDQYFGSRNQSFVGGNALNVAVQFSRLGHSTRYAGAIGPDEDGRRIRQALERNNVITDGLVVLDGVSSISRIRVMPDGERLIEFEDFAVCADYKPDDRELDALAQCAFVHIGMSPFANEIRKELSRRGVPISQDCAVSTGFDLLDVAFCSAGDDLDTARAMAESAIGGGARLAVVTCGPAGSIAFDGTAWTRQHADPIEAVDTTGAGDSFIAGFIAAFARGQALQSCMQAGAATAAKTCLHWGGWAQEGQ